MDYCQLQNSDLSISKISLGTMSFSNDLSEVSKMIDFCQEQKVNLLDTADLYEKGEIEKLLGKAMTGKRDQFVVASKVGNVWNSDGSSWHWDPSPKHIRQGLEQSLNRLNTDYLDLYQLHGGTIEDPWDDIFSTFEDLKAEGKIRAYGVSSIRPNVVRIVSEKSNASTIMSQYSPLDRRPEENIFPLADEAGIKILARGVFAKGLLINKPSKPYLNHGEAGVASAKRLINSYEYSPESILIRFAQAQKAIGSLVIGARTLDQLKATLQGFLESKAIPDDLIEDLQSKLPVNVYESHR